MELKENQVVKLRNGKVGVVTSFNGKPFQIIFDSYSNPVARYDKKLEHKNHDYDIVSVFSGESVSEPKDVFKKSFDIDALKRVWRKRE